MYEGKVVKLRRLELADADQMLEYWNDYQLRMKFPNPFPRTLADIQDFIDSRNKGFSGKWIFTFGIEEMLTGNLVGFVVLSNINWISRTGMLTSEVIPMKIDPSKAMTIKLSNELPPDTESDPRYRRAPSRGYDLWQYTVDKDIKVELASDQTSCHDVYGGGYTPQGLSFEEGRELLNSDRSQFNALVDKSLIKQFELIKKMTEKGTFFWDYGNSFMKAVFDAGGNDIAKNGRDTNDGFIFPSYVEDIMGPICFDYGYGPFRWVCLTGKHEDLVKTDHIAMEQIDPTRRGQDRDNYIWIRDAEKNALVVGSQARILYADAMGRVKIALEFNKAVREGKVGPIMLGRDHHDTGGTDSPFRETANIFDGSNITSDMAHQCWAGNAARGMTLCVLSNGGGVGTGKAINGGFGLVLDGSERVDEIIRSALDWDTMCGVSRRAWARNDHAVETAIEWNERMKGKGQITVPYIPEEGLAEQLVKEKLGK